MYLRITWRSFFQCALQLSKTEVGPENLHHLWGYRWCLCCWPMDHRHEHRQVHKQSIKSLKNLGSYSTCTLALSDQNPFIFIKYLSCVKYCRKPHESKMLTLFLFILHSNSEGNTQRRVVFSKVIEMVLHVYISWPILCAIWYFKTFLRNPKRS